MFGTLVGFEVCCLVNGKAKRRIITLLQRYPKLSHILYINQVYYALSNPLYGIFSESYFLALIGEVIRPLQQW